MAPEDSLRLGVLMAGEVLAVRIDEAAMVVHGLTPKGERRIELHPSGRRDQYLREVREFLAGFASGSPGGYPVHLRRWTRMGQAREEGMERLLLFGEPEAVVSVACSIGLTDELARRVWWIMPDAENARRMLERACVAEGNMGRILVDYLVEFLPFESSPAVIMETVKLVLKSGLANMETKRRLWKMGARQNAYIVPFLTIQPDDLPEKAESPGCLDIPGNLGRVFSGSGQTFLRAACGVLDRVSDRDVAIAALDAVSAYFSSIEGIDSPHAGFEREFEAIVSLSGMDSRIIHPILARTTATGTLLRTKLDPVVSEVLEKIGILMVRGSRPR